MKQSPEGLNSLPSFDNFDKEVQKMQSLKLIENSRASNKSFLEYKKRINNVIIESDPPNEHLDTWNGVIRNILVPNINNDDDFDNDFDNEDNEMKQEYDKRNVHLTFDNLLLRGSELRNSDWCYAIVIYTGFDCKIFMNNKSRERQRIKRSSVEKVLGKFIYYMVGAQFFICLLCAILSGNWSGKNKDAWYLYSNIPPQLDAFYKFFTWFIIFAQFIPISLLVSMDAVKFIQAQFMQWDINM